MTPARHSGNGRNGQQPAALTCGRVLDLFAGIGGLSSGFKKVGFSVVGIDSAEASAGVFRLNGIGRAITSDLMKDVAVSRASVVVGGPPCRPWSIVNLTKRRGDHPDAPLLGRFFEYVRRLRPKIFLMENVPPVRNDPSYKSWIKLIGKEKYSVAAQVVHYNSFGASTARRRLLTVGIRGAGVPAAKFLELLRDHEKPAATVRDAIYWARGFEYGSYPDHIWPQLQTIGKYKHYYESGKYGWYQLDYSKPAPSFGNILKTYILHPEAGHNGFPLRVLSVREALCIMGFGHKFRFPKPLSMIRKYQMVADAVSPYFSVACARVARDLLASIK